MRPWPFVQIVVVAPGKPSATVVAPNTFRAFRHIVGGFLEVYAPSPLRERGMHCYINEDGHRLNLAPNFCIPESGDVLGTAVVSAADGEGDEIGLDDDQAAYASTFFDAIRGLRGGLPRDAVPADEILDELVLPTHRRKSPTGERPRDAEVGDAPDRELRLVTSVRVERSGAHDRVSVWNNGALAGVLVVQADDGRRIAARLIADDTLRGVFRSILDEDPDCPLKPGARQYGSDDPAVEFLMAGFLVATVYKRMGVVIETERARRIVVEEFEARRRKRQAELS